MEGDQCQDERHFVVDIINSATLRDIVKEPKVTAVSSRIIQGIHDWITERLDTTDSSQCSEMLLCISFLAASNEPAFSVF